MAGLTGSFLGAVAGLFGLLLATIKSACLDLYQCTTHLTSRNRKKVYDRKNPVYKLILLFMKPSLATRIIAVVLAISSMLFMQLALAAYVCPGISQGGATMMASSTDMPGCDGMDVEQTALCHAHTQDQSSKQTLDRADLPPVAPFIAGQLVQALVPVPVFSASHYSSYATHYPSPSAAPPIAILHCCFRI